MYLRKTTGPRTVTLPDGSVLSMADLPPPDTDGVRYLRLPLDRFRTGA